MKELLKKNGTRSVLATVISILVGLIAGSILILIVGLSSSEIGLSGAWEGIRLIMAGTFSTGRTASGALSFGFNPQIIGNMLFRAVPLILCGLSVALAYKTGLFNIGASGQYLADTCATLYVALSIPAGAMPQFMIWILAFLSGILAGALWGAIPGMLKAFLNINEVLACIMTNWIAANLVTWLFDISNLKNMVEGTKTGYIYKTTYGLVNVNGQWTYQDGLGVATPKLGLNKLFPGSQVNGGILIAIIIAVIVYIVLTKTTFGYELKACGANRHAARYAGIRDKRSIVFSMAIAGALAGAAASLYYLSGNTELYWSVYQKLPAEGFNGGRHAGELQPDRLHLHRSVHVRDRPARSAACEPDGVQRVHHRRYHRGHRVPVRVLPADQDVDRRTEKDRASETGHRQETQFGKRRC